jgi:hypothetical protein
MTVYEVFVCNLDKTPLLVIEGRDNLLRAWDLLARAAADGRLASSDSIRLYEDLLVPGQVASALLADLGHSTTAVDQENQYLVRLSEI